MSSGGWIVLASAVGGLLALAGGLMGGLFERRHQDRAELRAASVAFLAAADALALTLALVPSESPSRIAKALDAASDKFDAVYGRQAAFGLRYLLNRPLYRRLEYLTDQFWVANARLMLVAPKEVVESLRKVGKTLAEWSENPGRPEMVSAWEGVRQELGSVLKQAVESRWWRRSANRG